jgi:hypothetical protein
VHHLDVLFSVLPYASLVGSVALVIAAVLLTQVVRSVVTWCLVLAALAQLCATAYWRLCTGEHRTIVTDYFMVGATIVATGVSSVCLVWSLLVLRQRMRAMAKELARSSRS